MKIIIHSIVFILLSCQLFSQTDSSAVEQCKRTHINSFQSAQRVSYFQYPTMEKYDVKYIKLDINAEANNRTISGNCLTTAKTTASLDSFVTELKSNMTVDSLFINGVKKTFTQTSDHIIVTISPAIPINTIFSALIYYKGTTNSLGVYAGTGQTTGLLYTATLSESYQAREWFPVKQILGDKIDSLDIWVTTSNTNKVGSNGKLAGIDNLANNKVRYRWKSRHPINYYLPSIAVGNYMEYTNYAKPAAMAPDSIMILHYLPNSTNYFNAAKTNLDKTPVFIEKFSELFSLYPFSDEKYGHSTASINGGMEHQTMSTMDSYGSTLIAHELGHQWFGDNVTCAKWNDIWVNEGFATYSEYLAIEKLPTLFSTTTPAAYMLNVHNNVMSVANGSVYLPDASVYDENRIFSSRLTYNKGAAIIHNLRFEMQSDSLFFQTLKNYQNQYKNDVATGENLKQVAEVTCNRNFADFFNQWYYGEGYPTFNITYYKPNSDTLLFSINETTSAPSVTSFFKGYLQLTINSPQGDTTIVINVNSNNQVFTLKYGKTPTNFIVDPNNWMLNNTGTITNGIVVPLKLVSFTGKATNHCSVILNWKTLNETNVKKYEIEKSTDGKNYTSVGEKMATNSQESVYQFETASDNVNTMFFRLVSIENDNNKNYSNVVYLKNICNKAIQFEITPNPVVDQLHINIMLSEKKTLTYSIIDNVGKKILQGKVSLLSGNNLWNINNINKLANGSYILQLTTEDGITVSKKFVKQ